MKSCGLVRGLLVRANHAPVAHHRYPRTAQFLFELVDLWAEGFQVVGVAAIDLDGNRLAPAVGQQAHHDLLFSILVITVITPGRQGVVIPFSPTAPTSLQ